MLKNDIELCEYYVLRQDRVLPDMIADAVWIMIYSVIFLTSIITMAGIVQSMIALSGWARGLFEPLVYLFNMISFGSIVMSSRKAWMLFRSYRFSHSPSTEVENLRNQLASIEGSTT